MLEFQTVEVGEGAPLRCVRCAPPGRPIYATVSEIAARIAQAAARASVPGPNLLLTGPEPFAHPELPGVVAACVAAGVERIGIETDGAALSAEDNASGALSAGVRHLYLRVLATDARLADDLAGRPGLVRAARNGLGAYLEAADEAGLTVVTTAVVPVCRHNVQALPTTVADLAAWGVHGVRLTATGAAPPGWESFVVAACDTGMVNRLWVETVGFALPDTHALHAASEVVGRD